jgi:hypothetical protein
MRRPTNHPAVNANPTGTLAHARMPIRLALLAGVLPAMLISRTLLTQPSETLRGRVVSDSARVIIGAAVSITRGPDFFVQTTATDESGSYSVTFERGTGDYFVSVQAAGFRPARRRVSRIANNRVMIADFVLTTTLSPLEAVKVMADRPVRASVAVSPTAPEIGASERFNEGVVGGIAPGDAGNILATVSTVPGSVMTTNGVSMLGASATSNLTTLNGLAIGATALPRAAAVDTRVTGATFDATRGGFSGANIDVRLAPGSRTFQDRTVYSSLDADALQITDAAGRALGAPVTMWRTSAGMSGEAIRGALLYNTAVDVSRRVADRPTLSVADPVAYRIAGIAADSVQRLRGIASRVGIPLTQGGIPTGLRRDALSAIARLDDTRDAGRTRTMTMYLNENRADNEETAILGAPSTGINRLDRAFGAQFSEGRWSGPGNTKLRVTKVGVGVTATVLSPYRSTPAVDVVVRSEGDTANAGAGVAEVALGGSGSDDSKSLRWTAEASHEEVRTMRGQRHLLRAVVWGRVDGLTQTGGGNTSGRFSFASLEDLEEGNPSTYTRTLVHPQRKGQTWNLATAASHTYRPNRFFSVLYGVRAEGNGLVQAPARNPALENALSIRTGGVTPTLHLSPRVGFTYTFSRTQTANIFTNSNRRGLWYRYPTGVLRGGIGEFRDLWHPDGLADASARTGLGGGTVTLSCVGAATPQSGWALSSSQPNQCRDGSGPLGEVAPTVTLLGRGFELPRSWRATLDYTLTHWNVVWRARALGSYDLNQPSQIDANFQPTPRLVLPAEADRPVFASPDAIDSRTGRISPAEARRTTEYGRVTMLTNDLRGRGAQLNVSMASDHLAPAWRGWPLWSVNYSLQRVDRQTRGFDGAAFGDPTAIEWAPAWSDARHQWVVQLGAQGPFGSLSAFARMQSGLPFTPLVQGDINGDGRSGDRAYIPDPSTTNDAALANGLRTLLLTGSRTARECLERSIAHPLQRNGCRGPWTRSINLTWSPPVSFDSKSWRSRVIMTVFATNVVSGLDQLLNKEGALAGWGGVASPNAILLVPNGFNAGQRTFRYDVNPQFAETRPSRTTWREPFRVTIDFRLRLHVDGDLQALRRAVEPVRVDGKWERRSADALFDHYLAETSSIYRWLVYEADSLLLRPEQIAALRAQDSLYSDSVRAIYRPLVTFLATQVTGAASKEVLSMVKSAQVAYWDHFWRQPEVAATLLDAPQIMQVPMLRDMLATTPERRKRTEYSVEHPVPSKHTLAAVRTN